MNNCLVAQSGGPTPIINSSLQGVIETALKSNKIDMIYGARFGINGLLKELIFNLTDEKPEEIKLLEYTPGSILGSCRYKLSDPKEDISDFEDIFKIFSKYDIKYFFYIGGNDSMDTVDKLNMYAKVNKIDIKFMGIPKTIDNDLLVTDHSPGFGSAAKYIATSVMETTLDSRVYQRKNVHLIEVMGRHAGWLAAAAALAGETGLKTPDLIYFPELPFSTEKFVDDLKKVANRKDNIIVVVSEGIKDNNGKYISASESSKHDQFGHKQMGGAARALVPYIKEYLYPRVKVIEFNVLQRAANHIGSKTDAKEAYLCGEKAVEFSTEQSATGKTVVIKRKSNDPYQIEIELADVKEIANSEKMIPRDMINKDGNFVTEKALNYLRPLIKGEIDKKIVNGLPRYANLNAAVTIKPKAELKDYLDN
ncbi:MAG: 6-phosphofructokinase [Halanaerobiales bacterium]|nr:6-phosphofructokinase [Halanaerobiales bacterium]